MRTRSAGDVGIPDGGLEVEDGQVPAENDLPLVVEAKFRVAQFFRSKALALAQNSAANLGSTCPMS